MLAVFERIDIGIVERLLSAATGESALPFVSFVNQIAVKEGSVPDAAISANFRYLFEVKTTRNALERDQLAQHLKHLEKRFAQERLFVLTPDPSEPPLIAELKDPQVNWLNFHGLAGCRKMASVFPGGAGRRGTPGFTRPRSPRAWPARGFWGCWQEDCWRFDAVACGCGVSASDVVDGTGRRGVWGGERPCGGCWRRDGFVCFGVIGSADHPAVV